MMRFFRRMQDTWLTKGILVLTALSFVSLFGVSGYIGSAGKNKPIIKVDNFYVTHGEISYQFEQELALAKNMFGDTIEISEQMRNAMMQNIVQKELVNTIIRKTADDLDISISDDLIRKVIFSQPEFMDANGNFSRDKLKRILAASGWNEQKYIESLKMDIMKQILVQNPVDNINVPKLLNEKMARIAKQKKIFKYITINPDKIAIGRKISAEELEQYYNDFNAQFMNPETRDVEFMILSTNDIANKIVPTKEEIDTYYKENISQFETPQTRDVLQMSFENQETADKAVNELKAGKDFFAVAREIAKQTDDVTKLGFVSKDMLVADMADAVFDLQKGEFAGPVKSEMAWHIMKVNNIKAGTKVSESSAKAKIVAELKKAKAYDEAYTISSQIEDQIGEGQSLENIAKEMNVKTYNVKNLTEDGKAMQYPNEMAKIIASNEFVDTAFSYNVDEISQVVETDDGFMVLRVSKIVDAHPKAISQVKNEIEKMWEESERTAIAQEIINDVMHDLESGDTMEDVATRFKLPLNNTKALSRTDSFETISPQSMKDLFKDMPNTPRIINNDGTQLVIVNTKTINDNNISTKELEKVKRDVKAELTNDLARQMIEEYGAKYKVRVEYNKVDDTL